MLRRRAERSHQASRRVSATDFQDERGRTRPYGTGAAFGGISGAFLASYLTFVDPTHFEISFSIFILAMVVLGGLGSISGVVVGAIILSAISSGIYGAILVVVMLLQPHGLVPVRAAFRPLD
jgi:branched-chain amino acid transport system permease protein